ncbi:MAG: S-adenosylmethionine:tRNA ribosyltransferase-isomerase [Singulisphaera sp.]
MCRPRRLTSTPGRPDRAATRRAEGPVAVDGRAPRGRALEHRAFAELPDLLDPGDVLVRNNTRVVAAH